MNREILEQAFDARFPTEMKDKLRNAFVAIAGLGGLGSNLAVMLARSGVGHIGMVDFDVVDVTNLNRQVYGIPHVGKYKTEALKEILDQINPYLDYQFRREKVTKENIRELFTGYPIVCEAFDQADQKAHRQRQHHLGGREIGHLLGKPLCDIRVVDDVLHELNPP